MKPEEYDQAFATYMDVRRRFQDLKLSRGYLPVVALQEPASLSATSYITKDNRRDLEKEKGAGKARANSCSSTPNLQAKLLIQKVVRSQRWAH